MEPRIGVTQKKIVPHPNSSLKAEAMKDTQLILGARRKKEKKQGADFHFQKDGAGALFPVGPSRAANTPVNYT